MKKFLKRLDPKILKICIYASITVIVTVALIFILAYSGDFWETLWNMFTAVLKPILIGGIICYLFLPLITRIERMLSKEPKAWTRPAAVAIFYIGIALILGILIIALVFALKGGIDSIRDLNFEEIQKVLMTEYKDFEGVIKSLEDQFTAKNLPISKVTNFISGLIGGIAGFFSSLMFGVIFSIYFMIDETHILDYWRRVVRVVFGEKFSASMKQLTSEADHVFSGYLRGQFMDAIIVGIMSCVILHLAGIPYAIVIGILIGAGNLIPYIGPVIGYAAVIVICLVLGQFDKLILGVILVAVIMFVDGNIINPRLLSDNIEVHPLLVVAALLAGGAIGGIVGMLIAVPSAAFIKLQFDKFIESKEKQAAEEAEAAAEEKHLASGDSSQV